MSSPCAREALSVAVGSPFFGGLDMLEHVQRHGWLGNFITLVNGNDPVPRVMNLAASLVDATLSCAFESLFATCVAFLTKAPATALVHATGALTETTKALANEIQKAANQEFSFVTSYLPIGQYVVFDMDGCINVQVDTDEVLSLLGPAHLLRERQRQTFVEGFLDHNAFANHELKAYQNIVEANALSLKNFCLKSVDQYLKVQDLPYASSWSAQRDIPLVASNLVPMVHQVTCETLSSHERQCCRIIKISGCNLDFLGKSSFEIDSDKLDPRWSTECVVETRISRRSTNDFVVEQGLRGDFLGEKREESSQRDARVRCKPSHDLRLELRSDVVVDGCGVATTGTTLNRESCHSTIELSEEPLSFFGGQFFLDFQQHAWIMKNLFGDESLHERLQEFQSIVQSSNACQIRASFKCTLLGVLWKKWGSLGDRRINKILWLAVDD